MTALLSVEGLSKRFELHALGKTIEGCRDVSFEVASGELLALAGPSGSGKSTVLKCLYRTYLPSGGRLRFRSAVLGEVDLARAPERTVLELRRKEIGYVSQFLRVIPRVPALSIVMEPLLRRGTLDRESARRRAVELLDELRIPRALHDAYPATFSGGEQQRVNIARAVLWEPRLLLLDEPTASLDAAAARAAIGVLARLRAQGTTMIGVFHDSQLITTLADRVHWTGGAERAPHAA
jgi:alpha-D-ribose 1-methylphosphonate 5-triphosphate synthase subunit PhnL